MRYILGNLTLNVSRVGIYSLKTNFGLNPSEPRWNSTKRDCCKVFNCKGEKKVELPTVTHVIFDLDGTLLNTEDINYQANFDYLCRVFNKELDYEVYGSMMGMLALEEAKLVIKEFKLPISPEVYLHGVWQGLRTTLETAKLLPGACQLVEHLHCHKIPIAIASSTHANHFKLKIKNHTKFFKNFCPIITESDDRKFRGKPHPDIFKIAARLFPEPPECSRKVLVIEDSPNGILAARAAGMNSLMVPSPQLPKHFIELVKPTMVVKSLERFKPETFGLPGKT